jgi:hypothetical protein
MTSAPAPSAAARSTGAPSYACSAYGLQLRSVVPLLAAAAAEVGDGKADAEVRWADLAVVARDLIASSFPASVTDVETRLAVAGIGTFLVRHGGEILVDPDPGADAALLRLALLGPVLAALLQQRGDLVLHASAVEIDGVAVGFLGGRGAGKSTLAAAFLAQSHPLLADDILAVSFVEGLPRVLPGFRQLKLWPDAVAALGGDPALLPRVRLGHEKRAQLVGGGSLTDALPLARLYVLSGGDTIEIESLSVRDAFLEVVAHSYGNTWLHGFSGPRQFGARAELVRCVSVRTLRRPPGLDLLPHVTRRVEEDLATR